MSAMECLEGNRKGSVLYAYNNFLYRRDKVQKDINQFRCRREMCPARASERIGSNVVILRSEHNHGTEDMGVLKLKSALKQAASEAEPRTSNKVIFDSMTRNDPAGSRVTFAQVERTMYHIRHKTLPRTPTSLEDAAQLLAGMLL